MSVGLLANDGLPGVFIVIGIIVVAVVIVTSIVRGSAHKATLQNVALKVGGTFNEGGAFGEPSLDLRIGDRGARLEFWGGSKNSSPYSKVVVNVAGSSPGILHILEDGFGQSFLKLFGAQDLEIGDPAFDRDYVIKATPSGLARRLFRRELLPTGIRVVRRLRGYSSPTFDVDARTVTVMVRQVLRDESALLTLIECARDFTAFAIRPPEPAGIVLEEVRVASGGECPVCGTVMLSSVRCEACETPHHSECWQYMGRCSTYACRGKRAVP